MAGRSRTTLVRAAVAVVSAGALAAPVSSPVGAGPAPGSSPTATLPAVHAALPAAARRAALATRWSADVAGLGDRVVVRGRLPGAVRPVVLQGREDGRWVPRVRTRTRDGRYRLPVPTTSYGTVTYRVVAPVSPRLRRAGLRRAAGPATAFTVARPGAGSTTQGEQPPGDPTDFTLIHSAPARWNPCRPITYRVNTAAAPASALRDTHGAVDRIEQATGLDLEYVGPTDLVPQDSTAQDFPRDTQIVVAWASPSESAMIPRPGVAGVGGPMGWGGTVDDEGADIITWRRGTVVLNSDLNDALTPGFGTGTTLGKLLMHEIGHVVGLGHAAGEDQVMFPTLKRAHPTAWGAGDLAGLRNQGAEQGCIFERDGSPPSFRRGAVTVVSEVTVDTLADLR